MILTFDITERRGDRRRLHYDLPLRMTADQWHTIIDTIDKVILPIKEEQDRNIEDRNRRMFPS